MVEFFTNTNLGIVLLILGQSLLVLIPLLLALAFLMYADRKVWAAAHCAYFVTSSGVAAPVICTRKFTRSPSKRRVSIP